MTVAAELVVEVKGRDVNVEALMRRVEAQLKAAESAAQRTGGTFGGSLTTGQARAAAEARKLSVAQAQVGLTSQRVATEQQRTAAAMSQAAAAKSRAEAAALRLARAQDQAANASQRSAGFARQMGDAFSSSLAGIVGPAAAAGVALGAIVKTVQSFGEAFRFKAELDATTASIRAQLTGVRDSNAVFSEGQAFANKYKLTQAELTATLQSSIGVMRTSNASTTDLLETLSRLQVLAPEKPISEAARAVRELASGDTTSIKELFNISARDANRMKTEIQGGADAVQVLSRFLDTAGIGMDALAIKTRGASGKMRELAQAQEELKLAQAEFAQGPGLALLQGQIQTTRGATRLLSGDFDTIRQSMVQAGNDGSVVFSAFNTVLGGSLESIRQVQNAATAAQQQQTAVTAAAIPVIQSAAHADLVHADAALAAAQAMRDHGVAAAAVSLQMQLSAEATNAATLAEQTHTAAMTEDALKAQVAAVEAQTLALRKGELARQAEIAANALIASGNAGAAAAGRLASSSSLVDQLTAAYLRLRAAQIAATGAALANTRVDKANSDAAEVQANKRSVLAGQRKQEIADYQKAQAAARNYQKEIGNIGPALARAEAELAQLPKGSAAAFDKMTEIVRLKEQQAQAAKRGAAKAGGAARLSDQQKLNNTLLADQEKFQDRAEAAEQAHQQKIIDIEREFQKKSLEQQRANEVSKRQGELDFLKSLTGSELNATKEGRAEIQRINEQFYAEFAAAQEEAQKGNAKQSEEMVAQAKRRADVELQYAEEIERARKEKNASEVTRLEALREKERQLLEEQAKQIAIAGDPNVKARDEALTEEERRFAEQQGKIGDAAEAAEQRKVNAAIRAGKAIDQENLKLQEQEAILNRIGGGAAGGATGGGGAVPSPPSTTAPTGNAPLDFSAVVSAIDALQPLLDAVRNAVDNDTRQTTTAIRQAASGERLLR